MKAYQLKVLRELTKKPHVPRKVKEAHGDVEEAIVQAGGEKGRCGHA